MDQHLLSSPTADHAGFVRALADCLTSGALTLADINSLSEPEIRDLVGVVRAA